MNKKFLSVILFSALMVGTAGTFTSCKDYDDDIESLDNRVSAVEKLVSDLQAKIDAGSVITGVDKTEDGIVIKLSNGESYPIKNGTNGTNAPVWSIVKDANGDYWWAKDNVQTEFPARGEKGEPGNGSAGQDAKTIYYYPGTEETGKLHGQAEAGYWVKVTEEKGKDPLYEVQTTKWLPEGTLSAVWNTKDETLTLGNMKDENGKLVEKTISLTTKLKALVFIPDLYEDGVEATKYKYDRGQHLRLPVPVPPAGARRRRRCGIRHQVHRRPRHHPRRRDRGRRQVQLGRSAGQVPDPDRAGSVLPWPELL